MQQTAGSVRPSARLFYCTETLHLPAQPVRASVLRDAVRGTPRKVMVDTSPEIKERNTRCDYIQRGVKGGMMSGWEG